MSKKQERKTQKVVQKTEEKAKKTLKQATKQTSRPTTQQVKDKPITKPKLETLPTITSLLATHKDERASKAEYVLPSILPFLTSYINKKQGSRVVQLLVKWGDQHVKEQIFNSIKKSWKELIRGKYSIFVLKQLVRHINLPELIEEAVTMQGIKEAAGVLDKFIKNTATGKQIEEMKQAFKTLSESGDDKDQETLDNLVMKIIEKDYSEFALSRYVLTIAMKNLVQSERDKVLEYLQPRLLTLINDNEGLRLFCEVVNYSSPKDRKAILKEFKPEVGNIIESPNHNSYISLLKLLHTIDDTVLLEKFILNHIEPYFPSLYENKKISNILYSLFSPVRNNFNIMGKWESPNHFSASKKSDDDRAGEIRVKIIAKTIEALKSQNLTEGLKDPNIAKLITSVLRYILTENFTEESFVFVKDIMNLFVADTKKLHIKSKDIFEANSLVCDPQAHRVLKTCISLNQQAPAAAEDLLSKSMSKLEEYLLQDLSKTLATKSSYVLIGILENSNSKDHILSMVKKCGVSLDKAVGGNIYLSHLKPAN